MVSETVSGGASFSSTRYLSFDHLGSLDAVTDETGAVVERFSFDAFGKRRQANWLVMSDVTLFSAVTTTRGFTGHEMVDPVGLIHMNGRVYDPELGRFISADPIVQDLSNLQSWNRYSYVLNNPLSMTDPTGFFFGSIFKAIGSFFSNIFSAIASAIMAVLNKMPILRTALQIGACAFLGPIACVGAAGALALASGGSLAGALQAMAFSVFDMGAWFVTGGFIAAQNLTGLAGDLFGSLIHGAVGGGLSAMKGSSFMDGFIPAFASGMAAPAINSLRAAPMRIAASAIVGGTSSVLTGGKFVNGAVTAAFARMFNDEMHRSDATCGAAAGGAAAMCIGTAAAGVSCPATGATCAIAPSAAVACAGAVTAAIAVCSIASGSGGGSIIRVHGNSAASMQGTEVYYLINNITSAIDKIGITSYPGSRYPQSYLDAENVRYVPQTQYTWRYMAMVDENIRLVHYQIEHGQLPRLNRTLR